MSMPPRLSRLLPLALTLIGIIPLQADPLKGAKRIVFLGDSITAGGHFIVFLESALRSRHPETQFINLGLPSEGCTGLSEPAHPFPRPNVHPRLDDALSKARPDLVFACYGMNGGIYYPFSEERFAQYKKGIATLIEKVDRAGAALILMSSPPFDPLPLRRKGRLLPKGAKEFSWTKIYEHYDRDVLTRYASWLVTQEKLPGVTRVIDLHSALNNAYRERRKINPEFTVSGDGVHPDQEGHRMIADAIHRALYQSGLPDAPREDLRLIGQQHKIMHAAWLTHVGHQRPGMRRGLPLGEAKARAAALRAKQEPPPERRPAGESTP